MEASLSCCELVLCHCCVVTDFLELCGQVTSEMSILTALVQNLCEATVSLLLVCWGPGLGPALWAWEDCEHLQGKTLPSLASSPGSKGTLSSAGPALKGICMHFTFS